MIWSFRECLRYLHLEYPKAPAMPDDKTENKTEMKIHNFTKSCCVYKEHEHLTIHREQQTNLFIHVYFYLPEEGARGVFALASLASFLQSVKLLLFVVPILLGSNLLGKLAQVL